MIGGTEEFGDWSTPKIYLKQLEDDVWTLEKLLVTQKSFFLCKFAIVDSESGEINTFERGVNRIIDLDILTNG